MLYSIILILKKQPENKENILEIQKYIEEKEGKILSLKELGDAKLNPSKKSPATIIFQLQTDIKPEEVEKIKRKINHEKEVVSYVLEKTKIAKKIKPEKIKEKKSAKDRSASGEKKKEIGRAKDVLSSMQEEEKKIKDLDSTLDKILNE